ncbi:hypothetical protein BGZ76_000376 [Entomortierella beljakovae]|nr:hypothetical protein BGZ76_000376 [Entomortierella beljakovae]
MSCKEKALLFLFSQAAIQIPAEAARASSSFWRHMSYNPLTQLSTAAGYNVNPSGEGNENPEEMSEFSLSTAAAATAATISSSEIDDMDWMSTLVALSQLQLQLQLQLHQHHDHIQHSTLGPNNRVQLIQPGSHEEISVDHIPSTVPITIYKPDERLYVAGQYIGRVASLAAIRGRDINQEEFDSSDDFTKNYYTRVLNCNLYNLPHPQLDHWQNPYTGPSPDNHVDSPPVTHTKPQSESKNKRPREQAPPEPENSRTEKRKKKSDFQKPVLCNPKTNYDPNLVLPSLDKMFIEEDGKSPAPSNRSRAGKKQRKNIPPVKGATSSSSSPLSSSPSTLRKPFPDQPKRIMAVILCPDYDASLYTMDTPSKGLTGEGTFIYKPSYQVQMENRIEKREMKDKKSIKMKEKRERKMKEKKEKEKKENKRKNESKGKKKNKGKHANKEKKDKT